MTSCLETLYIYIYNFESSGDHIVVAEGHTMAHADGNYSINQATSFSQENFNQSGPL